MLTLRIWFLALERVARLEDAVHEHRELLTRSRPERPSGRRTSCAATSPASSERSGVRRFYEHDSPAPPGRVVIGCGIVGNSLAYHLTSRDGRTCS